MAALVNSAILAELRSLYPYLELEPLTRQQETLIHMLLQGSTLSAASRGAGYSTNQSARNFLETERAKAILKYFSERELETIRITRDKLTAMYLELYGERGNTNEGARVLEGLARLHGLNEEARQKKAETNVTINQQNNTLISGELDPDAVRKKLEVMDEKQLIEQAGPRFTGVDLDPEPVDVTPVEVMDDHNESER